VLLTGAPPQASDGPAVNLDYADIWSFTQDNLFSAARRAGLTTAISGYYWFEKLVPQDAVDLSFYTPGEDRAADREVVDAALPWLETAQASLVLVHIDQVDYAGHHEGGPRDARWNEAAARADALLGEILAAVDLTTDSVLVVSDHGHISRGGHGGHDADVLQEPFVLAGAGIVPGDYAVVRMVDVAPTLAALLGTNMPASAWGQPLTSMLALDETRQREIRGAERAQQAELRQVYRAAIGAAEELESNPDGIYEIGSAREAKERMPRLAVTAVILLSALGWIFWKRPEGMRRLVAGGILAVAVFYLYYAGVEGRALSLSAVDGQDQMLRSAAIGSLLGLLSGGLLAGARSGRLARPEFWTRFALAAAALAALPALWSYLLNGIGVTWTLPDVGSAFVGVLAALNAACLGLGGLVIALVLAVFPRRRSAR